jgi:hypothetical protein
MDYEKIYNEAFNAGMIAGNNHNPVPMIVQEHSNPLDDNSPVTKTYAPVMGGVCGFAWINIKPATNPFVKFLKSMDIGHKSYYGGYDWWISEFGQSMEKKEAFAQAAAKVLNSYGIKCYATSRMD